MYTEKAAGETIKNAAQGLFTFATYGVGMFIGTWYSGFVVDQHKLGEAQHAWTNIWLTPADCWCGINRIYSFFQGKKISS
jgi:hypothetical protein